MTTISQSVRNFETWLAGELGDDLVKDDLREKHEKMRSGDFVFLRATYWRWCEIILDICPELGSVPEVLAIGDTHLENFGTCDISGFGPPRHRSGPPFAYLKTALGLSKLSEPSS